jgi:hypothetical protein
MCKTDFSQNMSLCDCSNDDLLMEIISRGLISNDLTMNRINQDNIKNFKFIYTHGIPDCDMICRECGELKHSSEFTFYNGRVDRHGYLMRSNAICDSCKTNLDSKRSFVLDAVKSITKPKKGDICDCCGREWHYNWHRHHEGDTFIGYICGHCNMSLNDQRNKTFPLTENKIKSQKQFKIQNKNEEKYEQDNLR